MTMNSYNGNQPMKSSKLSMHTWWSFRSPTDDTTWAHSQKVAARLALPGPRPADRGPSLRSRGDHATGRHSGAPSGRPGHGPTNKTVNSEGPETAPATATGRAARFQPTNGRRRAGTGCSPNQTTKMLACRNTAHESVNLFQRYKLLKSVTGSGWVGLSWVGSGWIGSGRVGLGRAYLDFCDARQETRSALRAR